MAAPKRKSHSKSGKRTSCSRGIWLSLSPEERKALLDKDALEPAVSRKVRSEEDTTRFTQREVLSLFESIVQPPLLGDDPYRVHLDPLRQRIVELFEEKNPPAFGGEYLRALESEGVCRLFFQFHIELLDTRPTIWRRIQLADGTLTDLHNAIQGAFDWDDSHLHEFAIGGLRFGALLPDTYFGLGPPVEDEANVFISQLLPSSGKQTGWEYLYDFGDCWSHQIVFEGCGPLAPRRKYPFCIDGSRAAPPDDCGGVWSFANILAALADPDPERDEELFEWLGPFDPEKFSVTSATKRMRQYVCSARPEP